MVVLPMFIGFGSKNTTEEESALISMQYSYALGDLPIWAVKRACDRFSNGNVKPEEIQAKRIDPAFPPSTAQLHIIAREIARPTAAEFAQIGAILSGEPERAEQTPAEREATASLIAELHEETRVAMARAHLEETEADSRATERRTAEAAQRRLDDRMAEYVNAGLEPPKPGPGGHITSLSMMLHVGWTIQKIGHTNVLVAPPKEVREPATRPARHGEMGS